MPLATKRVRKEDGIAERAVHVESHGTTKKSNRRLDGTSTVIRLPGEIRSGHAWRHCSTHNAQIWCGVGSRYRGDIRLPPESIAYESL